MATLFRTFAINWLEKRLQRSVLNGGETNGFPAFFKYERVPLKFYIVETGEDLISWNKVNISALGLKITITDAFDAAAPKVQKTDWDKDLNDMSFSGVLLLDTALMTSYIGSAAERTPYMQIELTEGDVNTKIFQREITVKNSITTPTSVSPDPTRVFLDADEIAATFAKFVNDPGRTITFTSPGNLQQRVIGVDDGATAIDSFFPVI